MKQFERKNDAYNFLRSWVTERTGNAGRMAGQSETNVKRRGQKLITGYEILHFNNLFICESGDLASGEILDQRNSGANFVALAFDKVVVQPVEATHPSLLTTLVLLPMIPILSTLVLSFDNSSNFGLWPFRIPLCILAVRCYISSSIGNALTRWGTGQVGRYLAAPTIYGSLCAMWNRNSWCDRHLMPRHQIHTCGNTVTRRHERVSLLNIFEFSWQTICPANQIPSFL